MKCKCSGKSLLGKIKSGFRKGVVVQDKFDNTKLVISGVFIRKEDINGSPQFEEMINIYNKCMNSDKNLDKYYIFIKEMGAFLKLKDRFIIVSK